MKQWTGAETTQLLVKSWLWMTLVTAPATTFVVVGWRNPGGLIIFVPASLIICGIGAAIGALVSIPFSHALSRLLVRVRSRIVRTLAHALLAGVLAVGCVEAYFLIIGEGSVWPWSLVIAAPAALAAAIARWRLDIVELSTIPGTENPELADEPTEGAAHAA
ncbi:hypothetical protein [Curtobacterium sp. MCSS17_016]|uniref:hypothetical protein n=1 Tax=Curtobacterium sp. MCSS17_016 TaxID=2175644 RepID=UPI0011B50DDE|nr:hypothetical protein [Curtobacterium sp. MCSS17_016]WIE80933.1 hypothetical protein DEJ19_020670 [Curtobacterium sp. MCSS17_016]